MKKPKNWKQPEWVEIGRELTDTYQYINPTTRYNWGCARSVYVITQERQTWPWFKETRIIYEKGPIVRATDSPVLSLAFRVIASAFEIIDYACYATAINKERKNEIKKA